MWPRLLQGSTYNSTQPGSSTLCMCNGICPQRILALQFAAVSFNDLWRRASLKCLHAMVMQVTQHIPLKHPCSRSTTFTLLLPSIRIRIHQHRYFSFTTGLDCFERSLAQTQDTSL